MKRYLRIALAVLCALTMVAAFAPVSFAADATPNLNPPVVETQYGKLMGYMNSGVYAFAGIPYATAGRFEEPKAVEPWEGVKAAQAYGAICPIPEQTAVGADEFVWPHRYWIQNEACQFLNIWTKAPDAAAKKPVMVFLHGGGFTNGSSIESWAYDGANLADYGDVVVVTLNHRLNALGYLDLSAYGDAYKNTPNLGMADIVVALRWVKDNIAAFGGDPSNVTIFGQSGGGGKVLTLLRMPSAEGLFKQAVVHSGSASYLKKEDAQKIAKYTFEQLGLADGDVEALKAVPTAPFITAATAAVAKLNEELKAENRTVSWRPEADGNLVQEALCDFTKDIPLMVGTVFSEQTSTFKVGDGRKNEWTEEEIAKNLAEKFGDKADAIKEEFAKVFPEKKVQDAFFFAPTNRVTAKNTLKGKIESGSAPVYNFLFNYEAPVNGGTTAFHCADLIYVFHNVDIPIVTLATGGDADAHRIQDQMATAWVNFAKTGNPSQEGLEWQPYTPESMNTMVFDVASGTRALDDGKLIEMMTAR